MGVKQTQMIHMMRQYTPWGVIGEWNMPGYSCATLERPWQGNARGMSCIPEGVYTMQKRQSPVVSRITSGRYPQGWEITDVPGRTHIMVHPGNWVRNSDGCVLVGRERTIQNDELMITHSQTTFDELMTALGLHDEWLISIESYRVEYP